MQYSLLVSAIVAASWTTGAAVISGSSPAIVNEDKGDRLIARAPAVISGDGPAVLAEGGGQRLVARAPEPFGVVLPSPSISASSSVSSSASSSYKSVFSRRAPIKLAPSIFSRRGPIVATSSKSVATPSAAPVLAGVAAPSQAAAQAAAPLAVSSWSLPSASALLSPSRSPSPSPSPSPSRSPSPSLSPSPSPSPSPAAPSLSAVVIPPADPGYQQTVLYSHNVHRANHSAPALTWDNSLYQSAYIIASSCAYGHNMTVNGGGYGQNIAAGMPTNRIAYVITEQFYNNEINWFANFYGQPTPDFTNFHLYGHFTQLVWKGTGSVACASVDCSATGLANVPSNVWPTFHVCNYGPPGNWIGEFDTNVLPPLGQPTIHG